MANASLKVASNEASVLDYDNSSESSDSEVSVNGCIRINLPGTAAASDDRDLDSGNEEETEVEEEEGEGEGDSDSDSGSDAWESESLIEDSLENLEDTTNFGARK